MTYSIIGLDAAAGEMGVAACSYSYAFAPRCIFSEPGVGVGVSQLLPNPQHSERALSVLRSGGGVEEALAAALEGDADLDHRQLVVMSAAGEVAAFTGTKCIESAWHVAGAGCSAQGVILCSKEVCSAALAAFEAAPPPLADRLIAALTAARDYGGDLRGEAAAALTVVSTRAPASWYDGRRVDIRIDGHPNPLRELSRQLAAYRAHTSTELAFLLGLNGGLRAAITEFETIERRFPDDPEVILRYAILLAAAGESSEASRRLTRLAALSPGWKKLVLGLPAAGFLPTSVDLPLEIEAT